MEETKPKELEGVEIEGRELVAASLDVKKRPDLQDGGFISLEISPGAPRFQRKTPGESPDAFMMAIDVTCRAWSGKMPASPDQPSNDRLLMICKVKVDLQYRIKRAGFAESDVKKCEWYYHPQASILAIECLRDILKDTQFAAIPIGLPGFRLSSS